MFGALECPFYKSATACSEHPDCLFNRTGGCSIVLGATIPEGNKRKLEDVERKLNDLVSRMSNVEYVLHRIDGKS